MSFSKTRCVTFQALKSLGNRVWGPSRRTKSLDFLFSLVMDSERSFWQSRRNCHLLVPPLAR